MNEGISAQGAKITALGRYKLLRLVGRGGMGEVWLSEDPSLHRQVAIKTLPAHNKDDQEYLQRFVREAQAAASLNHPHIVPVHDYGEQLLPAGERMTYLVMPYIPGGSLEERIRATLRPGSTTTNGLTEQTVLAYLWQAAQAIDYAHSRGIVHRDIKPANMLLRNNEWLMLADFGIARVLESSEHLTETGMGFGTPHYMAPEQAQGKAEPSSDTYSLAIIAYRILAGRFPFEADSGYAITIQHLTMPMPSPRQFNSKLPEAAVVVLGRELAKDPADRYPDAQAFVRDLQRSLANSGPVFPIVPAIPVPVPVAPFREHANTTAQQQGMQPPEQEQTQQGMSRRGFVKIGVGGVAALAVASGVGALIVTHQPQTSSLVPAKVVNGPTHVLRGHNHAVSSVAWSSKDPNILATAGSNGDNFVYMWDMTNTTSWLSRQDVSGSGSMLLAWSPDNNYIGVGNYLDTNDQKKMSDHGLTVYNSNRGTHKAISLASGYGQNQVYLESYLAPKQTLSDIEGFSWVPGGTAKGSIITANTLWSDANNATLIQIWDGTDAHRRLGSFQVPFSISSSADPNVSVDMTSTVTIWETTKLAVGTTSDGVSIVQLTFQGTKPILSKPISLSLTSGFSSAGGGIQVAWSPDGRMLAALDDSSLNPAVVVIWDTQNNNKRTTLSLPDSTAVKKLLTLAWEGDPKGTRVAAGADDSRIYIWDSANTSRPPTILNPPVDVQGSTPETMSWSKNGKWLAASYNDGNSSVLVWNV
ncbi:STKc_PknB_like and WD40 domain-containing protein [Ktedonobacteria bacterium brp13]|nr:STKc_PknB_like and WD40 domain-containing protein [Ktedonobacteria bacterium brp13]